MTKQRLNNVTIRKRYTVLETLKSAGKPLSLTQLVKQSKLSQFEVNEAVVPLLYLQKIELTPDRRLRYVQTQNNGWTKTVDKLPKKFGEYLTYCSDNDFFKIAPFGPDKWAGKRSWLRYIEYWMPLPKPPNA